MTLEVIVGIVVGLTGIIAVIVSLLIASTAAKRGAFEDLKQVVDRLERDLVKERTLREKLEEDVHRERRRAWRWEDWARRLVRQLRENNLEPVAFDYIADEDENLGTPSSDSARVQLNPKENSK